MFSISTYKFDKNKTKFSIVDFDKVFSIDFYDKENYEKTINAIFSSIVNIAHQLNNKTHNYYVYSHLLKNFLIDIKKRYFNDEENKEIDEDELKFLINEFYYFSKSNRINTISESYCKLEKIEDKSCLDKILDISNIKPIVTKIERENLFNNIADFSSIDFIINFNNDSYDAKSYKRVQIKDNRYVFTDTKDTMMTLVNKQIDLDKSKTQIAICKDNQMLYSIKFNVNLKELFSQDQMMFIQAFNQYCEKYSNLIKKYFCIIDDNVMPWKGLNKQGIETIIDQIDNLLISFEKELC